MARIEFSKKTIEAVAARSGYRCSMPACNRLTIGPGVSTIGVSRTGVAAHIYSAAPGGPRGQGGLSEAELAQPDNCVWLCAEHARLVDAGRGEAYSPARLLSYKHLQESRTAREQRGIVSPYRWLHQFRLLESPLFEPAQEVLLGAFTLVVGDNDTGKSALCEWLSAFSTVNWIDRWRSGGETSCPVVAELEFFDPEPRKAGLCIGTDGGITYQLDGDWLPTNPIPIQVVFPRPRTSIPSNSVDDLQSLSWVLSVDPAITRNLAQLVNETSESTVGNVRFSNEHDGVRLLADVQGTVAGLSFASLSGGEQDRLLIEFSIALASVLGAHQPTLLILDSCYWSLDPTWFERYSARLSNPNGLFQSVASVPTREFDVGQFRWLGWEVVYLKNPSRNEHRLSFDQQIKCKDTQTPRNVI